MKKENDPTKVLLAYRSTPLANCYSPAELLMGRTIKSTIPIMPKQLTPKVLDKEHLKKQEKKYRTKQKEKL